MDDRIVYGIGETGTWQTGSPTPHVTLDGGVPSGVSIVKRFDEALSSGEVVTVTVRIDADNWSCYGYESGNTGTVGPEFTSGNPDILDFSAAHLLASKGMLSPGDPVEVWAELPEPDYAQPSYDTAQSLRDAGVPSNPTWTVVTIGAITRGDGGGGGWYWDATSTADDNLGTVLKPAETGDLTSGRWKRQYNGNEVNILWFGPVGDGSVDDTAVIQAALDINPLILDFAKGDYHSIKANLPSNITIQNGTFYSDVYTDLGQYNKPCFIGTSQANITFNDCIFDGQYVSGDTADSNGDDTKVGPLLELNTITNLYMNRVKFANSVSCWGGTTVGRHGYCYIKSSKYVRITDITSTGARVEGIWLEGCSDVVVDGLWSIDNNTIWTHLHFWNGSNFVLKNFYLSSTSSAGSGLNVHGDGITIEDGTCINKNGVDFGNESSTGPDSQNVLIKNVKVVAGEDNSACYATVSHTSINKVVIKDCYFEAGKPIDIRHIKDTTIRDCTIISSVAVPTTPDLTHSGIRYKGLVGANPKLVIEGCRIGPFVAAGVYISAGPAENLGTIDCINNRLEIGPAGTLSVSQGFSSGVLHRSVEPNPGTFEKLNITDNFILGDASTIGAYFFRSKGADGVYNDPDHLFICNNVINLPGGTSSLAHTASNLSAVIQSNIGSGFQHAFASFTNSGASISVSYNTIAGNDAGELFRFSGQSGSLRFIGNEGQGTFTNLARYYATNTFTYSRAEWNIGTLTNLADIG